MLAVLLSLLAGIAGLAGGSFKSAKSVNVEPTNETPTVFEPVDEPEEEVSEPVVAAPSETEVPEPEVVVPVTAVVEEKTGKDEEPLEKEDTVEVADPVDVTAPTAPTGNDTENENETESAEISGTVQSQAIAGRVTTFDLDDDSIESVEIISGPEYGNVTVNPDNTLALVLSGTDGTSDISFRIQTTHSDGTTGTHDIELDITEGAQAGGWGVGDVYMLEVDENDQVIVEHGENHEKIYVSASDDALSFADIAARENMDVEDVTQYFLRDHAEYGRSEEFALSEEAGLVLWQSMTEEGEEPSSDWLLLERGYDYDLMHDALENGTRGESAINPILIGAYGEGTNPVFTGDPRFTGLGSENVVFQGVDFLNGFTNLSSKNLLMDDTNLAGSANIQSGDGFSLINSSIVDSVDGEAKGEEWSPHGDRESGIYVSKTDGVLIQNSFFDHNGWEDGYDPGGDGDLPQPPSIYSHNVYLQYNNLDVTFRDNITMRGASFGAQVRSGGLIEDNAFIDNNAAVSFLKGTETDDEDQFSGNYTIFTDNLITSAGHRAADDGQGALSLGISAETEMAALVDNIVAHLADPNNPDEFDAKTSTHDDVDYGHDDPEILYDDTITYNWVGGLAKEKGADQDANVDGLDTDILDQTTIQLFTAQLLGKSDATIEDLANYLRAEANGSLDDVVDADLIIDFFQTGFGITPDIRGEAETLRFVPNALSDGVRWDNRLNWNTEDLPGAQDGDSVDLAGNWVYYGGTTTLEDLDFGDGGKLNVTNGSLTIDDHIAVGDDGAELIIDNAGQFFTDGYTDQDLLTINAMGGRFANTDLFTGRADLNISDDAQVILATDGADYVVNENSSISITGGDAKVGFDGDQGGTGVLLLDEGAELSFIAEDGEIGQIREFYSGHYEETDIQSGVNLGDAELVLDLTDIAGGDAFDQTIIEVDELVGNFDNLTVVGLGGNQDAEITVDYDSDTVLLTLGKAGSGSGNVSLNATGDESNAEANADLWGALTNGHGIYAEDPAQSIPEEDDVEDL